MRFGVPMALRDPKNHHDDCYCCMVDMSGWNQRKKKDWYYPDFESARRLIPHCTEVPVPVFTSLPDLTANEMLLDDIESSESNISGYSSLAAAASSLGAKPKPLVEAN